MISMPFYWRRVFQKERQPLTATPDKMKQFKLLLFSVLGVLSATAQNGYWQQQVDYTMEVNMDVNTFQYEGSQKLIYTNNSPDELSRVYYHLFFNAFQPGSQMDARLQSIKDPDGRMMENGKSRIASLAESDQGYLHVQYFHVNMFM